MGEFSKEKLQEMLGDHQIYHSDFQMDWFILTREGGTPYGQYKQCLRELYRRYRGLKQLIIAEHRSRVEIEKLEAEIDTEDKKFDRALLTIDLDEKKWAREDLIRNIRDTEREFSRFYGRACLLKEYLGEITPEKRKQLDQEMWEHNLKKMAAVDYFTSGRLSNNTLEFLQSLPAKIRAELGLAIGAGNNKAVAEMKKGDLLTWFLQYTNDAREQMEKQDVPKLQSGIAKMLLALEEEKDD